MKDRFKLHSIYEPKGDQPAAISSLVEGINRNYKYQTLLGVTGSGKTFTMANVIEKVNLPTLVIAPNKTLAAQLYSELKDFFPENRVEYFVSYYDYYQPEAYVPSLDLYIAKDADINENIERLRQSTVRSLIERRDVIVVASVSCIYGWQEPRDYIENIVKINVDLKLKRDQFVRSLIGILYERNDIDFRRGTVRVRGNIVDVFPAESEEEAVRVEFLGDEISKITVIDPLLGKKIREIWSYTFFPAKQFVTTAERINKAIPNIREELKERIEFFKAKSRFVEAERIEQRTNYDLEILETTGTCPGVENYSRHLAFREEGATPSTVIDYFQKPFLMFIDESHITVPQIKGMYLGDRSRKETLVEFGFRLPSALDNRPLRWDEFESKICKCIFVSATPGALELSMSSNVAEQIIRPTGLIDPEVVVKPIQNQIDDLIAEINKRVIRDERVLVTTLTKRMAEDLSYYLLEHGIKAKYLHSDIDTIERTKILKDLRNGLYTTVVGINLLREGLDLPEVSLVAIMDADKEGFLRSEVSLIQTIGRASRNINGKVILYADNITESMRRAINETNRRREKQVKYNLENNIEPETIKKAVKNMIEIEDVKDVKFSIKDSSQTLLIVAELEEEMHYMASMLEFEEAAKLRDKIKKLKEKLLHSSFVTLKEQ
jgi:excinuclease ABC subunit B